MDYTEWLNSVLWRFADRTGGYTLLVAGSAMARQQKISGENGACRMIDTPNARAFRIPNHPHITAVNSIML